MAGRPTKITPELCRQICDRLISVGSLRSVCKEKDMPCKTSIFRWLILAEDPDKDEIYKIFREQYTRARELSKDYKFDELQHELDDISKQPAFDAEGNQLMHKGKPLMVATTQSVQQARLYLDAFKWQSSKENPKKYGDKIDVEHAGSLIVNLSDKDSQA